MNAYPDSGFLYSLYIPETHSSKANSYLSHLDAPLSITMLVKYEVCQSIRFSMIRKNLPKSQGTAALINLERAITDGVLAFVPCNLLEVCHVAEKLSAQYIHEGYRSFDILHVATALVLGVREFLTFDKDQARLARAEGLKTPL